MEKAIKLIEELIEEHIENQFCTDYDDATETVATDFDGGVNMVYDVGRYETLVNLLNDLKKLEDK